MAILEFGTGEGSTDEEQSATRRSSGRAVEGDCSAAVLSFLTALRHRLKCAMLDAEDVGEGRREPGLGELRRESLVVWWVREGDVVGMCVELRDEREDIGAMDRRSVPGSDLLQVGRNGL